MTEQSLSAFCYKTFSDELPLQRAAGFEDLEKIRLLSGEPGGGIHVFQGERNTRVTLVDFRLGAGVPVPHHDNRLCVGAEIFQVASDLSYKLPRWGINSIIMQDGSYYFDTDFSFGFDLVMDYGYVNKFVTPFNKIYQEFTRNPAFEMVSFYESAPWVRTYVSPLFFAAVTTTKCLDQVYSLAAELISLWMGMFREAEHCDASFKQRQAERLKARNLGSRDSDRMGQVLLGVYGKEVFGSFFRAMAGT